MEGHSSNLCNDIADQIQRSARALTQEEAAARASKILRKSTKIGPKSVLEALLGHPGAIFPPRQLQERKKRPKRPSRTPPQGSKLGSKIHAKSTPKPSKRNTFLYLFSDRVRTPPGTDFHRIRCPKMEQKSSQNRCPERSCRKCKILKNFMFSCVF